MLCPGTDQRPRVCWVDNFLDTEFVRRSDRILKIDVFRLESGVYFVSLVASLLQVRSMIDCICQRPLLIGTPRLLTFNTPFQWDRTPIATRPVVLYQTRCVYH